MKPILLLLATVAAAMAAQVSGRIQYSAERPLAGASVTLTNEETGVRHAAWSNAEGYYSISGLQPGSYKLIVRMDGFQTVARMGIRLEVDELARIDLTMPLGRVDQSIVVESGTSFLESENTGVGTVVARDILDRVPLEGRGLLTLLEAAPGVVVTPAVINRDSGQFSINGHRADSNYITVDGVSVNAGIGTVAKQGMGGALPAFTAIGSMHSLVSTEALEEFRIETSGSRAESGRMPGGRLTFSTRSGVNQLHGSVYEFLRNSSLDANDWFANRAGLSLPLLQFHDFGATAGGPIRHDRTFYFVSQESLRLRQSTVQTDIEPDATTRQQAPAAVRTWLMTLPCPTGQPMFGGVVICTEVAPSRSHVDTTSLRLDHTVSSRMQSFFRYQHAPSFAHRNSLGGLQRTDVDMASDSWTSGLDAAFTRALQNHLRLNYTRVQARSAEGNQGSAANIDLTPYSPMPIPAASTSYTIIVSGVTLPVTTQDARNTQHQWNAVEAADVNLGRHLLQFGADYRRLAPDMSATPYTVLTAYMNMGAFLNNQAIASRVDQQVPVFMTLHQLSAFVQDTWKLSGRLTLIGGVRWQFAPPPAVPTGLPVFWSATRTTPIAYRSSSDAGTLWPTERRNFAPQLGLAWKPSGRRNLVVRTGAGVFYDLGLGSMLSARPWSVASWSYLSIPMPSGWAWQLAGTGNGPDPGATPSYSIASAFRTPRSVEWNTTLEQRFADRSLLSISYVGSVGRHLSIEERTQDGYSLATSRAASQYNALQAQFRTQSHDGLQALLSFSWAHSIDNASIGGDLEFTSLATSPDISINRGDSDFDVRRSMFAVVTWQPARLHGWSLDGIGRVRGGFPLTVFSPVVSQAGMMRPNLVYGQPIWIAAPDTPGGRALNPLAFQAVSGSQHGTLGRNSITGPGMSQIDVALQKQFALSERLMLRLRLEAFNIFNHPNFGNPDGYMSDTTFGRSTTMLNQSLGTGGPDNGLAPALQIGGPRALQIGLRLHF